MPILPGSLLFWSAYADLQHERPPARYVDGEAVPQRIPWSAIAGYARYHGLNVEELKRVIWSLDDLIAEGAQGTTETATEEKASD